jgi:hypothetical protein
MKVSVIQVAGIGPKTAVFLKEHGIDSVEALLASGVGVLAQAPGFGETRARQVLDAASALLLAEVATATGETGKKKTKKKKKKQKNATNKKDKKKSEKGKKGEKKKKKEKRKKKKNKNK